MANEPNEKNEKEKNEKEKKEKSVTDQNGRPMEANLSTLVLSIASSAAMSLGLAPNPMSGKTEKDLAVARFNIDLLVMLQEKTKGNRTSDEERFVDAIVQDLKMKFVQAG